MSDKIEKPSPRPAASYALLYPLLCELVKPLGYALTLHGSMNTDLDLVAIPWVEDAAEPEEVVEVIREAVKGFTGWDNSPGLQKPHGRKCWLIWFLGSGNIPIGGRAHIDLSIMPKTIIKEK